MIEVVTIGDATLYRGDCLEILPTLEKADVVITDVPYSARTHNMAKTNKGKGHGTKLVTFSHVTDDTFTEIMDACLAGSSRWVVSTVDHKHAPLYFDRQEFVRLGAWVKPNPMPQISADRPGQGHEAVLILHGEGRKWWNRGGGSGVWVVNTEASEYPTQKPLKLVCRFVSDFTSEGETILDPCMGSGTTGVAAIMLGRKFVGIEITAKGFDKSCERIERAYAQGRMFTDEPKKKQKQEALL